MLHRSPEEARKRAEALRSFVDDMTNEGRKKSLLQVAQEYEDLAIKLETSKLGEPPL